VIVSSTVKERMLLISMFFFVSNFLNNYILVSFNVLIMMPMLVRKIEGQGHRHLPQLQKFTFCI